MCVCKIMPEKLISARINCESFSRTEKSYCVLVFSSYLRVHAIKTEIVKRSVHEWLGQVYRDDVTALARWYQNDGVESDTQSKHSSRSPYLLWILSANIVLRVKSFTIVCMHFPSEASRSSSQAFEGLSSFIPRILLNKSFYRYARALHSKNIFKAKRFPFTRKIRVTHSTPQANFCSTELLFEWSERQETKIKCHTLYEANYRKQTLLKNCIPHDVIDKQVDFNSAAARKQAMSDQATWVTAFD